MISRDERRREHSRLPNKFKAGASGNLSGPRCPRCGGGLLRIPRRRIDLLLCVVMSVRRYACDASHCGWSGLRRSQRGKKNYGAILAAADEIASGQTNRGE